MIPECLTMPAYERARRSNEAYLERRREEMGLVEVADGLYRGGNAYWTPYYADAGYFGAFRTDEDAIEAWDSYRSLPPIGEIPNLMVGR